MSQSKKKSLFETLFSVVVGFIVSMAITHFVFPLYDIPVSAAVNFQITAIYTVASIIRGYFIRRLFVKIGG